MLSIFVLGYKVHDNKVQADTSASLDCLKAKGIGKVVCLAEAFKATLKDDQLALLQLEYSKEEAVRWSISHRHFPGLTGLVYFGFA